MKVWDINVGLSGNKMDIWKSVDNLTDKINDIILQRNFAEKKAKEYEELQQENKELKEQQKEFINFLEDNYKETQDTWYIKILQKYRSIIGVDKNEK